MGNLGRTRTFTLQQADLPLNLPSDLLGVNTAQYRWPRADGNHRAAVAAACDTIRRKIREVGSRKNDSNPEAAPRNFQWQREMVLETYAQLPMMIALPQSSRPFMSFNSSFQLRRLHPELTLTQQVPHEGTGFSVEKQVVSSVTSNVVDGARLELAQT